MNRYDWTLHFLLWPRKIEGRWRWLCWVECREIGEAVPDGELREGELTSRWLFRMPQIIDLSQH